MWIVFIRNDKAEVALAAGSSADQDGLAWVHLFVNLFQHVYKALAEILLFQASCSLRMTLDSKVLSNHLRFI